MPRSSAPSFSPSGARVVVAAERRAGRWAARAMLALLVATTAQLGAQTIPVDWLRTPPDARKARLVMQGAERYGWPAMALALRVASLEAYRKGGGQAALAWRNAARWAGADAPESRANSGAIAPEWLWANPELTEAYFALEQPEDDRAAALRILADLRARDLAAFEEYGALALAIALVYDVSPPSDWPHWQVPVDVLPRRLPAPAQAFAYFVELDRSGKSLHRLANLRAAELRFLVDLAATEDDLLWARKFVRAPLSRLHETYAQIAYRQDRVEAQVYVWPGPDYRLARIFEVGGICVDQAYFATQSGKARGVPTLLFSGAGRDGRHAWFGYLGAEAEWRMDAGRYEEQQYVVGQVIDPQTWREISDHELAFLSEGFRNRTSAREAAIHAEFARWCLEDGSPGEAETAARAAVRLERRELRGWEVLLDLRPQPGPEREGLAREAAAGLSSYPELNARFMGVVIESLGARGETAEAERLGRELARRFADKRGDLSVAQISRQLAVAADNQSIEEQIKLYRSLLRRFGRGAGAAMWDEVVRPFVSHLAKAECHHEASDALALARETLVGVGGSQLDAEMRQMAAALRARTGTPPAEP